MSEDQSSELRLDENNLLSSTEHNVITDDNYDFSGYEPYIEKIRTLFVPSLEPRIYSCLETFVYRQDPVANSDSPYLKRCLDVAATWRDPLESFCTKWRELGFLEKIIANAMKFLIRDGLINCLLNSIILNNRLNKVCRDLDDLGVEKDLLRYLAVWNYINERDYWHDDDKKIPTSKSDEFYDSIDHHSDLDVEVGSGLGDRKNDRIFRTAFKRRANDDSSDDLNKNDDAHKNEEIRDRFPSRLSIDSSNPEGSRSSSARQGKRSCQTYPCRPSTCPSYRIKNIPPGDWEGKTLKLQLCKATLGTLECERELGKPLRLSKLLLPCKFDDLIAEIVKTDWTSRGSTLIQGRKKFQAAVANVCRSVNEILKNIDRNKVRRCRLHCEILPGCVSFRLIERKPDGCKVCLFNDRATIDRIDEPNILEGSSGGKPRQIRPQQNSEQTDLTIYKNTGFAPADDESQIVRSFEQEATITQQPGNILLNLSDDHLESTDRNHLEHEPKSGDILLRLSDDDLEAADRNKLEQLSRKEASNHLIENNVEDLTCGCNTSLDHSADYGIENNDKNVNPERGNSSKELTSKKSVNYLNGNAVAEDTCDCGNFIDDRLDQAAKNEENNETTRESNSQELAHGESLHHSNENVIEDQKCDCNNSFNDTLDLLEPAIEANHDMKISNRKTLGISDFATNTNGNEEISGSILEDAAELDPSAKLPQDLSGSSALQKYESDVAMDNPLDNIACACPSDCTCPNRCTEENKLEQCHSQCSCNSCGQQDTPMSLKKTKIIRMASLLKPVNPVTLESEFGATQKSSLSQRNETSVLPNIELQSSCLETQAKRSVSRLEFPKEASINSEISLESNVTKVISFIENESKQPQSCLGPAIQQRSSAIDKSPKKLSIQEHPIVSARLSRAKGQRINISIEMCPDSESSKENILANGCRDATSVPLHNEFKGHKPVPLVRKFRRHSIGMQDFDKQVLRRYDKNTNDECLRGLSGINARVHSPPRPLESRDYMPPFRPPSSMRNPIVYGMSMKSGPSSNGKFERRSISRDNRPMNFKSSCETKEICNATKFFYPSTERNERINRREEMPKMVSRLSAKPEIFSPLAIRNNVCHAFSSSSVDRMKHLIKTKLRRILLERDKATNTPKTSLTNKKYRVSVPNGKNDRSPFRQQRCRTIWESRSASDSTTKSYVSNDRMSSSGICDKTEVKTIADDAKRCEHIKNISSRNFKVDRRISANCRVTDVDTNFRRLAGGSDIPYRKSIDVEDVSKKKRCNIVHNCVITKTRTASDNENGIFDGKTINHSCEEDSKEVVDSTATSTPRVSGKKIHDEYAECSGKLDWSGNSTSRHIYLWEFDRLESSNDKIESPYSDRKNGYSLPTVYSSEERRVSRKGQRVYEKNAKNSRPRNRRFIREASVLENIRPTKNFSSKINDVTANNNIREKAFGSLDRDLRMKLSQYVTLCKNVKYTLLKRLRPDDIYEVSRTSIPCCDRYKFGDT